jgi:hypothetical protein
MHTNRHWNSVHTSVLRHTFCHSHNGAYTTDLAFGFGNFNQTLYLTAYGLAYKGTDNLFVGLPTDHIAMWLGIAGGRGDRDSEAGAGSEDGMEDPDAKFVHWGVTCDFCQGVVVGARYKYVEHDPRTAVEKLISGVSSCIKNIAKNAATGMITRLLGILVPLFWFRLDKRCGSSHICTRNFQQLSGS